MMHCLDDLLYAHWPQANETRAEKAQITVADFAVEVRFKPTRNTTEEGVKTAIRNIVAKRIKDAPTDNRPTSGSSKAAGMQEGHVKSALNKFGATASPRLPFFPSTIAYAWPHRIAGLSSLHHRLACFHLFAHCHAGTSRRRSFSVSSLC